MIQEGLDSMDPSKNADTIEGKTVEDWLEQGIKFLNLSQLNEALQAFNMALQLDPQNSQVWANKAIVLCLLGKLDEHINALNKVSQEDAAYVISEIRRTGRWFLSPIYSKETKLGSQEYDVWRKKGDAIFNKYDEPKEAHELHWPSEFQSIAKKKLANSKTRYLNAFFADKDGSITITPNRPLVYGQKYMLCVEICPERRGLGEDDQPFPDNILSSEVWKDRSSLPLLVCASSRDFEIEPRKKGLDLPREGATSTLKFSVRSIISQGYGSIMVEIFLRGYLLQSKRVEALIISTPASEATASFRPYQNAKTTFLASEQMVFQDLSLLPERLLTINVECNPHDGSVDFRFLDRTGGERNIAFFDTRLQPMSFDQAISAIRHQLKLMVTGKESCKGYRWGIQGDMSLLNAWLPQLANVGHSFYRALLPEGKPSWNEDQGKGMREALKPGTTIQVNPVLGMQTIPWAMLYEREVKYVPETKVCDQFRNCSPECTDCPYTKDPLLICPYSFWGYRYAIEQLPCWVNESMPNPPALIMKIKNNLPIYINLNVWRDFALWKEHISNLEALGQVKLHVAEVRHEMEKIWKSKGSALDLVYFYCHGGEDEVHGPYLEISDCRIDSNFLEASHLDWQHNPLVFLNGCATGDYGPKSYISLIDDFRKGGACGVVGTECPVTENFARAYADALFPKFFCGQPLGQAMLNVRLELLKEKLNPLGLVYTLYAYNNISLATPVAQYAGFGGAT